MKKGCPRRPYQQKNRAFLASCFWTHWPPVPADTVFQVPWEVVAHAVSAIKGDTHHPACHSVTDASETHLSGKTFQLQCVPRHGCEVTTGQAFSAGGKELVFSSTISMEIDFVMWPFRTCSCGFTSFSDKNRKTQAVGVLSGSSFREYLTLVSMSR